VAAGARTTSVAAVAQAVAPAEQVLTEESSKSVMEHAGEAPAPLDALGEGAQINGAGGVDRGTAGEGGGGGDGVREGESEGSFVFVDKDVGTCGCIVGGVTSFVTVRGSIPLRWGEADSFMSLKPRPELELSQDQVNPKPQTRNPEPESLKLKPGTRNAGACGAAGAASASAARELRRHCAAFSHRTGRFSI
jgi:hypothetical protein